MQDEIESRRGAEAIGSAQIDDELINNAESSPAIAIAVGVATHLYTVHLLGQYVLESIHFAKLLLDEAPPGAHRCLRHGGTDRDRRPVTLEGVVAPVSAAIRVRLAGARLTGACRRMRR